LIDPNEELVRQLQVRPFLFREAWDYVKARMPNVGSMEIRSEPSKTVIARISYSTEDVYIRDASKKRG